MEPNRSVFAADKPLDQDLLGYAPYVRAMANLISNPLAFRWLTRNPFTLDELDKTETTWEAEHRPALIHALTESYGERVATDTADGFIQFMRSAHDDLKVGRFANPNELAAYLRISGVVDVSRPPSGVSMVEFVDKPLSPARREQPEKPSLEPESPPKETPRGIPSHIHEEYAGIVSSWDDIQRKGLLDLWFSRISLLENEAREIVGSAKTMNEYLRSQNVKDLPEESKFNMNQMISKLMRIELSVFFRQLKAASVSLISAGAGLGLALSYSLHLAAFGTQTGYFEALIRGELTTPSTGSLLLGLALMVRGFLISFRGLLSVRRLEGP